MANRLELNWAGRHDGYALIRDEETGAPVQVPYDEVQPRLLIEAGRYGDETPNNIVISGENLYALKTLVKSGYAGKIKCIYIDPPFNTGEAFQHYDDSLEHSLWLIMMRDRIRLLHELLSDTGSMFIHIDDNELAYLIALTDEIFDRKNRIRNTTGEAATTIWADLLSNNVHNEGGVHFPNGKKPELLIKRILELSTKPGDTALDCFAGSGTTGAVALKMNRRFIMIEAGNNCETHIVPRLKNVINGTDTSGVSSLVLPHPSRATTETNLIGESTSQLGWTSGGGFSYYTLSKSLIEKEFNVKQAR